MCFFWLSTTLLFERMVEDKPVWTDMPGVSVGLALSSLLESQKQHSQSSNISMSIPLWGKGALINTEQQGAAEDADCQGGSNSKKHITNARTCEILSYSLSCDEWCWRFLSIWRKLGCPHKYTHTLHRCNFQYSLSSSAEKPFSLAAHVAVLSWTKALLTCLEPGTGGKSDFRKASISYSKHRAAFIPWLPKAKPVLGREYETVSLL